MNLYYILLLSTVCLLNGSSSFKCYHCDDIYYDYFGSQSCDYPTVKICNETSNNFCFTFSFRNIPGLPRFCEDGDRCYSKDCNSDYNNVCKKEGNYMRKYGSSAHTVACCEGDYCNGGSLNSSSADSMDKNSIVLPVLSILSGVFFFLLI